jgi:ferritin-like metal-binding protein YciE
MAQKKLRDAFIDELRDTYDAERQLTRALPKMAKAASSPELQTAFNNHLEETRVQIERIEKMFELLDERARGKHCDGIAGIIEEGSKKMEEDFDESTLDACLIGAGQRAEHYEMAAYGTLAAWARQLGHMDVAELLDETLEEEKAADQTLSLLAEKNINAEAVEGSDEEEEDEEAEEERKPARRQSRGGASRSAKSSSRR